MPYPEAASKIRMVIFDIDGTLTDGSIVIGPQGESFKTFNVRDGLGIQLLMRHGIKVGVITGRRSAIVTARMRELGVPCVFQGQTDKRLGLNSILDSTKMDAQSIAYMGDDLPDLGVMAECGLAACPADAHEAVLARCQWVSQFRGGRGAAREFAEMLLKSQGKWDAIIHDEF